VPRAELPAGLVVAHHVGYADTIDFCTDDEVTKDRFHKGLAKTKFNKNTDLWGQLSTLIKDKHLATSCIGCPAIRIQIPQNRKCLHWMKQWHVNGDNQADGLASDAAESHTAPADEAKLASFTGKAHRSHQIVYPKSAS